MTMRELIADKTRICENDATQASLHHSTWTSFNYYIQSGNYHKAEEVVAKCEASYQATLKVWKKVKKYKGAKSPSDSLWFRSDGTLCYPSWWSDASFLFMSRQLRDWEKRIANHPSNKPC